MMRWIIGSSLKFRFIVLALATALMVFGASKVDDMPVDVFPEFAPPFVEVQTEGLGMSTEEVESLITVPLEQALNSTPGLDVLRSKTVPGLSSIKLVLQPGTDSLQARQFVNERLAVAITSLPASSGIPWTLPPLSATSRALKIGISSQTMDVTDLSMIAYWKIRWRLMSVPGVANVAIWGDRFKQVQVLTDPQLLRRHNVSVDEALQVTSDALEFGLLKFTNAAKTRVGGFIETPTQRLPIEHVLAGIGPDSLARVAVNDKKKADGSPLLIGDLGNVVYGHQPLIGDAVINDRQGLLLIVEKLPWGNTLDVTRGVEKALDEMRPGLPGIEIDSTIFRPATFIELSLDNLTKAILIGTLLVLFVLAAFLFEWRAALISLLSIPLSLVAAVLVLHALGETINTLVLAGFVIAVGVVVDDSIIDIENVVRRLRQHRREGTGVSTARVILNASLEVRNAMVYATLIIILAVLPVFFLTGLSGAFFKPLVLAYGLAVLASMVVAITVTPALSMILLKNVPLERRDPPLTRWLQKGYHALLASIVRQPRPVLAATGLTLVAGIAILPLLGQSLLPGFKERDFLMHWVTKPGSSHEENVRIGIQASKELRAIPGVRNFGSHIGRAVGGDEVYGVNFSENWISIDPNVDYDKTRAAVQEAVDNYPGLRRDVQTYLEERIKEVVAGSSEAIAVRIFGPDLQGLRDKAHEVEEALATIPGTKNLHVSLQQEIPHIQVKPDLTKAARYGLKPGDIRRAAATMVSGDEVSDLHKDGKVYDIIVWSKPETRSSLTAIRNLPLDTAEGGHVLLKDVADVQVRPTPNAISREDNSRSIDVDISPDTRTLGEVASDVDDRLKTVDFPLGYHVQVLGEFAERQSAVSRMMWLGLGAGILIFLLLHASFRRMRLAFMSFLTLPFALVGGVLAAAWTGGVISLGSLVGFYTVFGIAARNGILMINHFQHLEEEEGEAFGPALVLRGAKERLAPILMTALATGLALVPLVISGEIPGAEIEYPMAIVILGGLITSTLLNLFVVPSIYLRWGKSRKERSGLSADGAVPAS